MTIEVHLLNQSFPVIINDVKNTYQMGDLFCVIHNSGVVTKFPIIHVFCIIEGK